MNREENRYIVKVFFPNKVRKFKDLVLIDMFDRKKIVKINKMLRN
jgi:hypothetical protein